jgi:polysaccharide export outer membrane protein
MALLLCPMAAPAQNTETTPTTPEQGQPPRTITPNLQVRRAALGQSRLERLMGKVGEAPAAKPQGGIEETSTTIGDAPTAGIDPATYVLGAGDRLAISIIGLAPEEYELTVTPEGTIVIPGLGEVRVNDVSYGAAKGEIESFVRRYRKDVQVVSSLTAVRKIKVRVLGQVVSPGAYWAPAYTKVSEAIALAGGILDFGSVRSIQLQRDDAVAAEVDLARLVLLGDAGQDAKLDSGDVVYVPYVGKLVEAAGEFKGPGVYELLDGEGLLELLRFAGGLTSQAAAEKAGLERVNAQGIKEYCDLPLSDKDLAALGPFELQDGDRLYVPSADVLQGEVLVIGAVNGSDLLHYPEKETPVLGEYRDSPEGDKFGAYKLRIGERLRTVIWNVGGPAPSADRHNARVERRRPDGTIEQFPIDLAELLDRGNEDLNIVLEPGDRIIVPTLADRVYVLGEVRKPGGFNYRANRTIVDYLGEAGGVDAQAKTTTMLVFSIRGDPMEYDIVDLGKQTKHVESPRYLEPGDVVLVPRTSFKGWRDVAQAIFTALNILRGIR